MTRETKVTYATLTADNDELHAQFDAGVAKAKAALGRTTPLYIGGAARATVQTTDSTSPTDTSVVVARAAVATASDVHDAVAAAKAAYPGWSRTPWQTRVDLVRRAAQIIRERRFELSAACILEMGKNRVEALGEIEETADLYDYYADQLRANDGYVKPMARLDPADTTASVLRPYGVWAVIAPWNFPYALFGAPIAAALLAGNTVVAKPSTETPLAGALLVEIFLAAGVPPGTVNLVSGGGRAVGGALAQHEDVAGVTFTGSYDVGFRDLYQSFGKQYPKPCIVEMGGKNPAIVTDSADLDRAVLGVYRSAFGMNGHKCSACSRVYVHEAIADDFLARLTAKVSGTKPGDPLDRHTFVGPLATRAGFEDYQRFAAAARAASAIHTGGQVLTEGALSRGFFVQPTILTRLSAEHDLVRKELFVPMLAVTRYKTFDEAMALANDTVFGLTAGIFSKKQPEVDEFLDRIEAGVVYVNRAAGATTGAWPGVQPFGGWKASGSSGKNIGGLYTLPCYMREQSRTIVS